MCEAKRSPWLMELNTYFSPERATDGKLRFIHGFAPVVFLYPTVFGRGRASAAVSQQAMPAS